MGWRATLRSAGAMARRAERERLRRARYSDRLNRRVSSLLDKLSAEAERDARKVAAFEEKVYEAPVKTLELRFEGGRWLSEPFVERTGQITFSIGPGFVSDPVTFAPPFLDFEGRRLTPLAFCVSQYATFAAVWVAAPAGARSATAAPKLVNRSRPEESSVLLFAGEQAYYAFDGSIDGPVLPGTGKIGIIAFEPFVAPVQSFQLAFLPRPSKADHDPEPVVLNVAGQALADAIAKLETQTSLVDLFEVQADAQVRATSREVREAVRGAQRSGCAVLLSTVFAALAAVTAVAWYVARLTTG